MKNTDAIVQDLRMLIDRELVRANRLHGPYLHNEHEAIAVLGEEVDEAHDEMHWLSMEMSNLWDAVKGDYADVERVEPVQRCAENLAAEAIQVTAMCEKWKMNADRWEGEDENNV